MGLVLIDIKADIGIETGFTHDDQIVLRLINSAISRLSDMGVVESGTRVSDTTDWTSVIGSRTDLEGVKEFIFLYVKLIYDPPSSASVQEIYKNRRDELLQTLSWKDDPVSSTSETSED